MAESVNMAISDAIRHYSKPPSVVVNSAGITRDNFLLKMDENWFQKVIDINLKVGYSFRYPFIQSTVRIKEINRLSSIC
jgi:NAD(P)-dependent dehydrogenase (short-subunit alcohol dehydrogenase family)